MRWFTKVLAIALIFSVVVPNAEGGLFSRRRKNHKGKPITIKKPVEPKVKVPIKGFDVIGNENISKEVILLSLASKVGDSFTKERLQRDVDAVRRLGYFSSVETGLTPYQGGVRISFRVSENPVIDRLSIQGNRLIPTRRIQDLLNVRVGSPLNLIQLQDGIKAVNKVYSDKGYAFCGILSNEQFSIDPRTRTLRVRILEPKLRRLTVVGNKKTQSYVITREMVDLKKGHLLKTEDIKRAMRDVHNLGLFEDVMPSQPKFDVKNQAVDLNVEVKEQRTASANFGGAYSSVNGFIGSVDVAESNFRGHGQTVRAKYQFGGEQSFLLSFVEPWFQGKPVSVGGSVYKSSVDREQFVNTASMNRFREQRSGWGLNSSWRVARDTRLSASLADENIELDANVPGRGSIDASLPPDIKALDTDGDNVVGYHEQSLGLNWTKDKRDNYRNPRNGYRLSLGLSVTGGLLAGPNGYNKYVTDCRWYTPMRLFGGSTFAVRSRFGVTQVTQGELRFIDRFFVGGSDSIRGYEDRQFSGADYLLGNMELRKDLSRVVGVTFFVDSGDAWGCDGSSLSIKSSYGLGLRINTPLGPFRLDYGFPMSSGDSPRPHFAIGQSF